MKGFYVPFNKEADENAVHIFTDKLECRNLFVFFLIFTILRYAGQVDIEILRMFVPCLLTVSVDTFPEWRTFGETEGHHDILIGGDNKHHTAEPGLRRFISLCLYRRMLLFVPGYEKRWLNYYGCTLRMNVYLLIFSPAIRTSYFHHSYCSREKQH